MAGFLFVACLLASIVVLPSAAQAQAIVGTVRDASGAVLPGVTVEAASPALIEKVRVVVTDGAGQYRIEALRPGPYVVTFTLPGFATVRREGTQLEGAFVATVNAELRVGGLEETITVTGESPVVDLQSTTRQQVVDREVIDGIPVGRSAFDMAGLITGVVPERLDMGGSAISTTAGTLSAHGGRSNNQQVLQNGVMITWAAEAGFNYSGQMNPAAIQEVTVDTSAASAELASSGVRTTYITRDGGNTFSGTLFTSFTNGSLQGSNLTQRLVDGGLRTPDATKHNWDINPGFGGPIVRDRLWFFAAARRASIANYKAGAFHNLNLNNPAKWMTYEPDLTRPGTEQTDNWDGQLRLAWQVSPKNKLGLTWHEQYVCSCLLGVSATTSPEAANNTVLNELRNVQADWTLPLTNRVLFEAGFARSTTTGSDRNPIEGLAPFMIAIQEQSTGLNYGTGDPNYRSRPITGSNFRVSTSYITGTHAFKIGINHKSGHSNLVRYDWQPVSYRFNNGVPNRITQRAMPWNYEAEVDHDLGLYAQDKWTIDRLVFSYGVRYDYFTNSFPEVHFGPAQLAPTRNLTFPATKNLAFHDLTPKLGIAYDLFGTGKTAVKASLNKYVLQLATNAATVEGGPHPSNTLVFQANRSWRDDNGDFVPNCNLISPAANGECGALDNANFGNRVQGAIYDPEVLQGWGKRGFDWEFSVGVQHELLPRVGVDVSFFRRWYGNFTANDNRAVGPADFDAFSITAPTHPNLPGGGGHSISGLYDLNPAKFGVPADVLVTNANNFGKQIEHWNGVDVTVNARPGAGMRLQGGLSTGRTSTDTCEIREQLPEIAPTNQYCHVDTAFLTRIQMLGMYTIPRVDVMFSATLRNLPGPEIAANYVATNAVVAPSLRRNLSGSTANVTVNLVEPGSMYGERLNLFDVRISKQLRLGGTRTTTVNFDLFNALNTDAMLTQNNSFGAWLQPTGTPQARFAKFSVQFDF